LLKSALVKASLISWATVFLPPLAPAACNASNASISFSAFVNAVSTFPLIVFYASNFALMAVHN
jgi:hypothetical protein